MERTRTCSGAYMPLFVHLHSRCIGWAPEIEVVAANVRDIFPVLQELHLTDHCFELLPCHNLPAGRNAHDCLRTLTQVYEDLAKEDHNYSMPNIIIVRDGKPAFGPGF